jgi:hypothetical protein
MFDTRLPGVGGFQRRDCVWDVPDEGQPQLFALVQGSEVGLA